MYEEIAQPERELGEYRYRLARARRRAVRNRLEELTEVVSSRLGVIHTFVTETQPDATFPLEHPATRQIRGALSEIERLVGDSVERSGRWGDLYRHLRFSQPHDWSDMFLKDWPSVFEDIQAAGFDDTDPLPVDRIEDLGIAASGELSGSATTGLAWRTIGEDDFERVLFDLLSAFPEHHNVQWLTKTNAPDRGRDLSMERQLTTPTGESSFERVMVQAKHWLSKSVSPDELSKVVTQSQTWSPPFRVVIVATSGRFTSDAITWAESHAARGQRPDLQLWADTDLERLLSRFPAIAANHGLR